MSEIENNIKKVRDKIRNAAEKASRSYEEVKLVCVSKTHPVERIIEAMNAGERCFGENRAQEFRDKHAILEKEAIEWHFIGNIQKNKLKYIVGKASLIHSVDSLSIAQEINRVSENLDIIQRVLIEVNVSGESSKSGMEKSGLYEHIGDFAKLEHLKICGLMTMAPFTDDAKTIRDCFGELRGIKEKILFDSHLKMLEDFKHLSMGMSNDYEIAVEEGATIVRIGTDIFGKR